MASRILLRQRTIGGAVAALSAGLILAPKSSLDAESPSLGYVDVLETRRKPIYEDSSSLPDSSPAPPKRKPSELPTPTDRLTSQIARARLFIHSQASSLEDRANNAAARAFKLEHSFTSTIAGLAPSRQSGEQVLPGAIYVLVAAMGASVVTRNRNFLLRATAPVLVGIGAAQYLLPITSRNVGDLVWYYEKKFPVIAEAHTKTKERVSKFISTGIEHSKMGKVMLEDKIGDARESLEGWVSKGR